MNPTPSFFTLIIGTEILNRRRTDKHCDFVTQALERKGYFGFAGAAFSLEEQIGEKRNVVIKFDLLFALGAGGWRLQEAHPEREPENDNIEKTTPSKAEKQDDDYLFHHVDGDSTCPVSGL